jgi:hypothetical protein
MKPTLTKLEYYSMGCQYRLAPSLYSRCISWLADPKTSPSDREQYQKWSAKIVRDLRKAVEDGWDGTDDR